MTEGFYVTIIRGKRVGYLVGPCSTEPQARGFIDAARREALAIDAWTHFDAFGTARVTAPKLPPGVLNERVGYTPPTEEPTMPDFRLELPQPTKTGRARHWEVGKAPVTCRVPEWRDRRVTLDYEPDAVGERWTLKIHGFTGMPPRRLRYKTRMGVIDRLASIFDVRAVVLTDWRDA